MRPLRDALFEREVIDVQPLVSFTPGGTDDGDDAPATVSVDAPAGTSVPPIEISIRIGAGAGGTAAGGAAVADERLEIDPDYASRPGFDEGFLGDGQHRVPLPVVPAALTPLLAVATTGAAGPDPVLRYHHSSIVMHRVRRLALFTAVNIDGTRTYDLERSSDRWVLDPRIDPSEQTDNDVYVGNDLDRGHLVRRRDPVWGDSESEAKFANDDTFHYTNCSPQHARFNRNEHTWNGVENYILYNAENHGLKVCVFTGPVLADDDDVYRGIMLPRQYWKVVTMLRKSDDSLSTTAYLLSQASLLAGLEADEEFQYGAYRTYQVRVSRIAELTGLDFGPLVDSDPLAGAEATSFARELETPEGILL
jgi:endonuclease G